MPGSSEGTPAGTAIRWSRLADQQEQQRVNMLALLRVLRVGTLAPPMPPALVRRTDHHLTAVITIDQRFSATTRHAQREQD
jgi:hypothetical protein